MTLKTITKLASLAALISAVAILPGCAHTQGAASTQEQAQKSYSEKDLDLLSSWLVGSWDNIDQIEADIAKGIPASDQRKRYAMRYTAIDVPAVQGRIFAIENFDDGDGFDGALQRVSLHRFMLNENKSNIAHEILFLKDKEFRKSLIGNLQPLEDITEDDIRSRADCRLYWHWTGTRFEGATEQGACVTNSYTDRDITVEGSGVLEADRLLRHDRNFEMSGEEILRPGSRSPDEFFRVAR